MARILVADDQYSVQVWLEHILTQAGHSVVLAYNGRDVLEQLGVNMQQGLDDVLNLSKDVTLSQLASPPNFDVLVTDIIMPEVDGYRLLKWLREHHATIPVIVETVQREPGDVEAIKSLGASAVLSKPFTKYALLKTLDQVLGQTA